MDPASSPGFVDGFTSSLMYSFWRMLETKWRLVCDDIKEGRINPELNLDPHLAEEINKVLVADSERAEERRECFTEGSHGIAQNANCELRLKHFNSVLSFYSCG